MILSIGTSEGQMYLEQVPALVEGFVGHELVDDSLYSNRRSDQLTVLVRNTKRVGDRNEKNAQGALHRYEN